MIWRESLKLFGYQIAVAILLGIIGIALDHLFDFELPNVTGALGTFAASQAFAIRRYQKYRDDLAGRIFALSWRATSFYVVLIAVVLGFLTAFLPDGEKPLQLAEQVQMPMAMWIVVAVVGLGATLGVTAGGLRVGVNFGRKAEAAKLAKGAG